MNIQNSYNDMIRASSYAMLEFPNTYYLAYRDLPDILQKHVKGNNAIDFGCGTGRSTRFLKELGFIATGVDIAVDMIKQARDFDPGGEYILLDNAGLNIFHINSTDLIFSIFTFDNIPDTDNKINILKSMKRLLKSHGRIIMLDSTPEIYHNEWASFSTKDFPENKMARDGEVVRVIMKDVPDSRPVEDIKFSEKSYLKCFRTAGLVIEKKYLPLAYDHEPYKWINETRISPWVIYVLKKAISPDPELIK